MKITTGNELHCRMRQWVRELFERQLAPGHAYHNWRHTADVAEAARRNAGLEGVGAEERDLLLAAALFHDTGFTICHDDNESAAVEICRQVLPGFGFSAARIETIGAMILATRLPQAPATRLEMILCDADLDYLGRPDYFELSEQLRREWAAFGQPLSEAAWLERQIAFFSGHEYFLASVRALHALGKAANLQRLRDAMASAKARAESGRE